MWSYGVLAELRDFVARDLAEFIEARQPSRQRPVYLDENVQFTVYRPRTVEPEKWYHLLAFAHLSERRSDAPDEPDPLQEVRRQAEALLGAALPNYRDLTEDSRFAVPREHELIFLPTIPQVVFNPARRAFLWTTESVHREEFRMKTSAKPGEMLRGNMTVFLGSIILAEINLVVRVSAEGTSRAAPLKAVSSRPYHKIFASYSHRDIHIVEEFDRYVGALGHKYLRDAVDLRSGEVWNERLLRMIDEADIFQLFWSSNSMRSPFVRHEWEYALTLNRPFFVRPTYWEEPFPELPEEGLPPEGLRRMHFTQLRFAEIPPMAKFVPASPPLEKKKASSRTGNRACYNCDGAGRVTCSGCGGRGSIWHSSPSGPQWSPCAVCGGQRQLRCPVCQGVGQLSSSNFPPVLSSPPAPLSSPPAPPTYSPLTKWWSKLPDRSKMALLVGLGIFAILVVIYFLING